MKNIKWLQLIIPVALTLLAWHQSYGAQVKVLASEALALQTRIDLIKGAKEEILIESFAVTPDKVMLLGLGLLQEASRKGVKVKILVDDMHSEISRAQIATLTETFKKEGNSKNFEIKVFNPLDNLKILDQTYRNHDKLFLVDGKFAIIGGRNMSATYFGGADEDKANLKDLDLLIYGSEIHEDQLLDGKIRLSPRNYFLKLWNNPMSKVPYLRQYSRENLHEECFRSQPLNQEVCEQDQAFAFNQIQRAQSQIDALLHSLSINSSPMPLEQLETSPRPPAISMGLDESPLNFSSFSLESLGLKLKETPHGALLEGMYHVDFKFIYNDPTLVMKQVPDKLGSQIEELLRSQKPKQITIVTPYLFPTQSTLDVLKELSSSGAKLKILSNSLNSTDSTLVYASYEKIKPQLLEMKTQIYEFRGALRQQNLPMILHAKIIVFDEETKDPAAFIGSYNFDQRSALINREIGVLIRGQEIELLTKDLLKAIHQIQNKSILSDGSPESDEELLKLATPEKIRQLERDRNHPLLKIKKLNKHI